VGGGVQFCPLGTAATKRPTVPAPDDCDDGEIGGKIGKGNRSTRRRPAPVPRSLTRSKSDGIQNRYVLVEMCVLTNCDHIAALDVNYPSIHLRGMACNRFSTGRVILLYTLTLYIFLLVTSSVECTC
jgi:hypothetical protein